MFDKIKFRKQKTDTLINDVLHPFQGTFHTEMVGGVILIFCTAAALILANSPWVYLYEKLLHTTFSVGIGSLVLSKDLSHWINDGLMAIFFFVVGLEIKREILVGELSTRRQAILPIGAAIGGMIVPAAFYALFNFGKPGISGWGIPMATDIAFALGILALLGDRAPLPLKIFLTAVAIVDDIGAVVVIAVFYTDNLSWGALGFAALILYLLLVVNRVGVRNPFIYSILGILLWIAVLKSGVHATVAGVLLAMTIPSRTLINAENFSNEGRIFLNRFDEAGETGQILLSNDDQQAAVQALERAIHGVESPLQRLEHMLHPWVIYFIMPIFALANAGVTLTGNLSAAFSHPVSIGIIFGLVLGKQVGITLATWLMIRLDLSEKPAGVSWRQVYGVAWLGGIGFTMSLFIANIAFSSSAALLSISKIGILGASTISGAVGWIILLTARPDSVE